ncbi:LPXTG cell wall anchor domain-containing protein, partial [Specibacter sp. AOP5-B1-6]|uniref:LPXTG cell wall anchor domain-containing protein n=1 Tax=Specibacter sp. AOP5-B1-6 TaxID=3457653 RepID=UPI00402BC949
NGAENTAVNTGENTAVNTTDNTADNSADNNTDQSFELVPGVVTVGQDSEVLGENYTPNGTVTVQIKDRVTGVETDLTTDLVVGEDGSIEYAIETGDLAPGTYKVTVVDNTTGNSTTQYLVVNAPDLPLVKVDVTPKTVVKGDATLLTGSKFSANETATVAIAPVGAGAETGGLAAFAAADSELTTLTADQLIKADGTFALRVASTNLELGDYQLVVTDNKTSATDSVTFTVIAAGGNASDNTADNAAENTSVNTAANTAENANVNTAENTAENANVNTAANTAVNTAENANVNTAANTAVNTAENANVNTAANTAANGTKTTSGGKKLANTGAESLGLLIGGGSLLLLGAATMLIVRKRKTA